MTDKPSPNTHAREAIEAPGLDELCAELRTELAGVRGEATGARVARLLRDYARQADCWREWVHHESERYSRNLVYRCEGFELLMICWGPGQASAIHDHAGQECWMAVLDGELEEAHFAAPQESSRPLEPVRVCTHSAGEVAFIRDEIGLHRIRPTATGGAVSLHLYAQAIDECLVFDPADGSAASRRLGYDSVRGVPCPERTPDEIRAAWAEGRG